MRTIARCLTDSIVSETPTVYTVDGLIAVLELSHRFRIPSGIAFAADQLDSHSGFDNASRLRLASTISMPQAGRWFATAARDLLSRRSGGFTAREYTALGSLLPDVMILRARLEEKRTSVLVARPPHITDADCPHACHCAFSWHSMWDTYASAVLSDPSKDLHWIAAMLLSGERVFLTCAHCNVAHFFANICTGCFDLSRNAVMQSGLLLKEESCMDEILRLLAERHLSGGL